MKRRQFFGDFLVGGALLSSTATDPRSSDRHFSCRLAIRLAGQRGHRAASLR